MRHRKHRNVGGTIQATIVLASGFAHQNIAQANSTTINCEGVNTYPNGDQQRGADEVNEFMNQQLGWVNSPWQQGNWWNDPNVWDADFVDSDINANGDDLSSFDPNGNFGAISYFAGHGTCDDGAPEGCAIKNGQRQICSSGNNCPASNNPFGTGAGVCRHIPGETDVYGHNFGYCAYSTDRFIDVNGSSSWFGQQVDISAGSTVFGESLNSHGWRGAATDGGSNLVVLSMSNGVEPEFFWNNFHNVFGGAHMVATSMPTGGDWFTWGDRGAYFALGYSDNRSGMVADAWYNTMNYIGQIGQSCGSNGVTNGGYGGFNGCGCYMILAAGVTCADAKAHRLETWDDIQNDAKDGQGANCIWYSWSCNYDVNTYPWKL
jgi:hypothetical protein